MAQHGWPDHGQRARGVVPEGLKPVWVNQSPALAEVVRDINKYSNNVMTQQVLLTLGKERLGIGSFDAGRTALAQWWQLRWPAQDMPVVENGAGLSRQARISAQALGHMLQAAWGSSVMPEFVASMPISGMDGTLRRSKASANAHLKTGSLRDANTLAGYVHGNSGQRYVLVAMINHPNAGGARPVMDALRTGWRRIESNQPEGWLLFRQGLACSGRALQAVAYAFPVGGVGRGFNPDQLGANGIKVAQRQIVRGLRPGPAGAWGAGARPGRHCSADCGGRRQCFCHQYPACRARPAAAWHP